MQQAGNDADNIHAHVGQYFRYRERVHQIRLAGCAELTGVIPGRVGISLLDRGYVVFGAVIADGSEEGLQLQVKGRGQRNGRYFGLQFDPFGGCHTSILVPRVF